MKRNWKKSCFKISRCIEVRAAVEEVMLYRFRISLSNIDQGIYEDLDFRMAQHPSETNIYLLTRMLAFCLSYQEGLEFSLKGLGDPDGPALHITDDRGQSKVWIEIGNPSFRKLHKASKSAEQVVVYTYKNKDVLIQEIITNKVHRAEFIEIYALSSAVLEKLEKLLEKNNDWSLIVQDAQVGIEACGQSFSMGIEKLIAGA